MEGRPPGWAFSWHDHPEVEFTLIEAGSGLRYVGDSIEPFGPGDVCLLGPYVPHTWTAAADPARPCHSIVAQFSPTVAGVGLQLPELQGIRQLIERAGQGWWLRGALAEAAADNLRRMLVTPDPLERLAILWQALARCAAATSEELRPLSTPQPRGQSVVDAQLAEVLALIAAHTTSELPVALAARRAGLSVSGFCRWFRRRTGRTFVDYRNAVRIGLARQLLTSSRESITAIAFAAGFGSLANFNRRFLRETGCTPRAFRQRHRAGV